MNAKRKNAPGTTTTRNVLFSILVAIALVIVGVGGIFLLVTKLLEPVSTVVDSFLENVHDGDYESAFDLLSPGLKIQVEDADRLALLVEEYNARPESWQFYNQSAKNGYGRYLGNVTLANGESVPITIMLELNADQIWHITHFEWGTLNSNDW